MMFKKNCLFVPLLLLFFLVVPFPLKAATNYGVIFCDYYDSNGYDHYSSQAFKDVVQYSSEHFNIIRTTTDFHKGDPGQNGAICQIASRYIPPGLQDPVNQYTSSFNEAINGKQGAMKVILEIDNPKKWCSTVQQARNYIFQYVLPLENGLSENYWQEIAMKGYHPQHYNSILQPEQAGFSMTSHPGDDRYNNAIGIIVGHEVGGNISAQAAEDDPKIIDNVNNLDFYINNLIQALNDLNLKDKIYVTTTITLAFRKPDPNDMEDFIYTSKDNVGKYIIQNTKASIAGKPLYYNKLFNAIQCILEQDYQGSYKLGVLVSMYPYWNNQVADGLDTPNKAYNALSKMYSGVRDAFKDKGLRDIISIGEAGAPSFGDNTREFTPPQHIPSITLEKSAIEAAYELGQDQQIPVVLIWNLFNNEKSLSDPSDPENWYGIYNNTLKGITQKTETPALKFKPFPNFKG
ncbi:MAG: hypothetical protein GY710_01915 [Desulfobacteraceae bacterium]|nr:hypothetical protein [Desulfobacteraceae bacterium]